MRFTLSTVVAALPALSAAQGGFEQYQAQFQNFLGNMGSYIPSPGQHDPVGAAAAKAGSLRLNILTLENWRETIYDTVPADATKPEEWWILTTGRNKTCPGTVCAKAEKVFNETAAKFALTPGSPHVGMINCEDQPILCNSWSTGTANLWIFEMLPEPANIDAYRQRLNATTTDSDKLVKMQQEGSREGFALVDSWFHPFDGKAVELGLAIPAGYAFWIFNMIPSWAFMILVSMGSRAMMSNRMGPQDTRRPTGPPPAAQ